MPEPGLLHYQWLEMASAPSLYNDYIRKASNLGAKRIYHYHAMPSASKGIEPHIAFLEFVLSENRQSEEPPSSPTITVRSIQSVSTLNPSFTEQIGDSKPPLSFLSTIQGVGRRPLSPDDEIPEGNGKDLIPWSDDNVDATDFKNMEDYDPWQEDDKYESTPESKTTEELLENLSLEDKSCIRRYIMLHRVSNSERTSPAVDDPGR
jgi:hypothetical protein